MIAISGTPDLGLYPSMVIICLPLKYFMNKEVPELESISTITFLGSTFLNIYPFKLNLLVNKIEAAVKKLFRLINSPRPLVILSYFILHIKN